MYLGTSLPDRYASVRKISWPMPEPSRTSCPKLDWLGDSCYPIREPEAKVRGLAQNDGNMNEAQINGRQTWPL